MGTKDRECTEGMRRTWRRRALLVMLLGASIIIGWAWLSVPALAQTGATPLAPEA